MRLLAKLDGCKSARKSKAAFLLQPSPCPGNADVPVLYMAELSTFCCYCTQISVVVTKNSLLVETLLPDWSFPSSPAVDQFKSTSSCDPFALPGVTCDSRIHVYLNSPRLTPATIHWDMLTIGLSFDWFKLTSDLIGLTQAQANTRSDSLVLS